jgi:hypothetical protein
MRNYTALPLCPIAAVAVTTVTMPVLFWRILVLSSFSHDFYFGDIFSSIDKK